MAAAKKKVLASHVYVGGQVFKPGDSPAKEYADLITNPKAWAGESAESDSDDDN